MGTVLQANGSPAGRDGGRDGFVVAAAAAAVVVVVVVVEYDDVFSSFDSAIVRTRHCLSRLRVHDTHRDRCAR